MASMLSRYLGGRRTARLNCRSPSSTVRGGRAAHRRLDDGVHVAGIEAEAGRFLTIDFDIQIWLPKDVENPEIGDPST